MIQMQQCEYEFSKEEEHDLANKRNRLDLPNTGGFSQLKALPWVLGAQRELAQRESIAMLKNVLFT